MQDIIEIDGSLYEGGGQIVRNSLTLSTLLGVPILLNKVRANRPNPGFNNQLIAIFNCFTKQLPLKGMTSFKFKPQIPKYGKINNQSAASCTLVCQTILPIMICKNLIDPNLPNLSSIKGGTLVSHSPPILAYQQIIKPLLSQMGVQVTFEQKKRGYFPKGCGQLQLKLHKTQNYIIPLIKLQSGKVQKARIEIVLTGGKLQDNLKEIKKAIKKSLRQTYQLQDYTIQYFQNVEVVKNQKFDHLYAIVCILSGTDVYYDCTMHADKHTTVDQLTQAVISRINFQISQRAVLDIHSQDQLLLMMGLAKGQSAVKVGELTEHSKACLHLMNQVGGIQWKWQKGVIRVVGKGIKVGQL